MELFLGITLLAASFLLGALIFTLKKDTKDDDVVTTSAVIGALLMVFLLAGIYTIDEYCSPSITPMDVYRGKTTLEITYRDSIAIDSTVVWKEGIK